MNWFQRLFRKSAKVAPDFSQLPAIESFEAAGVIFADVTTVLAGYQPKKKTPGITGIGGKRQAGEHYIQTAHRECLEELFDWSKVGADFLNKMATTITPLHVISDDGYVNLVYTFDDLLKILKLVKKAGLKSHLYTERPASIEDLVLKRKPANSSEIQGLCLIPLVYYSHKHPIVQNEFRQDICDLVLLLCPHKAMTKSDWIYKPVPRNLPKVDGGFSRAPIA
jgi:hypothetical protein